MRLFSHVLVVLVPAYSAPDIMPPLMNPPAAARALQDEEVVINGT